MVSIFGIKFGHLDAKAIAEDQLRKAEVLHLECLAHSEELRMQAGRESERADLYLNRVNRLRYYLVDLASLSPTRREASDSMPF